MVTEAGRQRALFLTLCIVALAGLHAGNEWSAGAPPFAALAAAPVINDEVGGEPIAVLSQEGMLSALDAEIIRDSRRVPAAAAYSRRQNGRVLSFERRDGRIVDRETGSEWDIFGRAVAGPSKGSRLKPVDSGVHFAFAWLAFNPATDIYAVPGAKTTTRGTTSKDVGRSR